MPKQDFQELFVTCPDGLSVKYFLQSSIGENVLKVDILTILCLFLEIVTQTLKHQFQ